MTPRSRSTSNRIGRLQAGTKLSDDAKEERALRDLLSFLRGGAEPDASDWDRLQFMIRVCGQVLGGASALPDGPRGVAGVDDLRAAHRRGAPLYEDRWLGSASDGISEPDEIPPSWTPLARELERLVQTYPLPAPTLDDLERDGIDLSFL